MSSIFRTLFIGFGKFGSQAIFDLKKRLSKIYDLKGNSLINGTNIQDNPFQFLIYPNSEITNLSEFFRHYEESDSNLLKDDEEVIKPGIDYKQMTSILNNSISRLTNINLHIANTLNIDRTYLPTVIFIFDIESYKNTTIKEIIQNLLHPVDENLRMKYHPHAVVVSQRTKDNKEFIKEIGKSFRTVFLLSDEIESKLEVEDYQDMILNFLSITSQISDFNFFRSFFDSAKTDWYFSFGTTRLYFPVKRITENTVQKLLFFDDFQTKEYPGNDFYKFFIGEFRELNSNDQEYPFSLGDYEKSEEKEEIYSEEIIPIIPDGTKNKAAELTDKTLQWINDHIDRIKYSLQEEALLERIKDLCKPSNFLKIYLEDWTENLDMIDFLIRYEVIQDATIVAESLKNDFYQRWEDKFNTNVFNELTESPENFISCDHNGEYAYSYTMQTIESILSLLDKNQSKKDDYVNDEDLVTRKNLNKLIKNLPHPLSLLSRYALLTSLFVIFWNDFHNFFFSIFNWRSDIVPYWLTGIFLLCLICWFIYKINFQKKVSFLRKSLNTFLKNALEKHKDKLQEVESKLVKDFLLKIARNLRQKLAPRPGFLYHVIKQGNLDFNDLVQQGYSQFELDKNLLENFYCNRILIYRSIQAFLSKPIKKINLSQSLAIPPFNSNAYSEIVKDISEKFLTFKEIYKFKNTNKMLKDLKIWENPIESSCIKFSQLISGLINNYKTLIKKVLIEDERYKDLISFLETSSYSISDRNLEIVIDRAKPTFKMDGQNEIFNHRNVKIYSNCDNLSESFYDQIIKIYDRNNIVFLGISQPSNFSEIIWRDDND